MVKKILSFVWYVVQKIDLILLILCTAAAVFGITLITSATDNER